MDLGKAGQLDGLPLKVPELGKLELDVVTVHHKKYYAGPERPDDPASVHAWERDWGTAPDIEEPVPNVFPTVAPGHVFAFALAPLRGCPGDTLKQARAWLACGLSTFGIGAKTNAGYGWFDCGKAVQETVPQAIAAAERRRVEERRRLDEAQRHKTEEESRLRKAEELRVATKSMTPEQKSDYELTQLTDDQFRGRLESFPKREPAVQQSIVRALRLMSDQPGSRRKFWDDLKPKAQKGGKPAQIADAIRQVSAQLFPGKEGKMP